MKVIDARVWLPDGTVVSRVGAGAALAMLLAAGVCGGLLRAGVTVPIPGAAWPGHAVSAHAFLIMFAFMATAIGLERAVAINHVGAFTAPVLAAAAGLCMLAGEPVWSRGLAVTAAVAFVIVNLAFCVRQSTAHTRLLLLGAFALLVANMMFALGSPVSVVAPWWFAFLLLTVAAERLEMTRLMRRRRGAAAALHLSLGALLAGAAAFSVSPAVGAAIFGVALIALAVWLLVFDVARKTVATHGLSRYMATCLLLGYLWLVVAGLAWLAASLGQPTRDAALHALGIGFLLSMMLGHAPVILPAVARVKLAYSPLFYVPLAALHLSLVARLAGRWVSPSLFSAGAAGHAAALALFALTLVVAAVAWRLSHPADEPSRAS